MKLDSISKVQENGKRGQKAMAKLFQMKDVEIKEWLRKYTEFEEKDEFLDGTVVTERVINNEIPESIKLWNYGCIEIGWFGVGHKTEHGRKHKWLLNEETFYALLGE